MLPPLLLTGVLRVGMQVRLGGLGFWHGAPIRPSPSTIHNAVAKHSLFNARHLYLIPAVLDHIHPGVCPSHLTSPAVPWGLTHFSCDVGGLRCAQPWTL